MSAINDRDTDGNPFQQDAVRHKLRSNKLGGRQPSTTSTRNSVLVEERADKTTPTTSPPPAFQKCIRDKSHHQTPPILTDALIGPPTPLTNPHITQSIQPLNDSPIRSDIHLFHSNGVVGEHMDSDDRDVSSPPKSAVHTTPSSTPRQPQHDIQPPTWRSTNGELETNTFPSFRNHVNSTQRTKPKYDDDPRSLAFAVIQSRTVREIR